MNEYSHLHPSVKTTSDKPKVSLTTKKLTKMGRNLTNNNEIVKEKTNLPPSKKNNTTTITALVVEKLVTIRP